MKRGLIKRAEKTARAGALACGLLLVLAASAFAISTSIHISGTSGEGVFIRTGPSTSYQAVGWMPEGASPDYNCFVWGQNVNGVPIWFNVNYNGVNGYYASFYDDSSYHSNEELTAKYGVPLCGAAPPSSPAQPPAPAVPGGSLVYSIVHTEGGVFFRNSPSWNDTPRITGIGVYDGDRVQVVCGAMGEAIGPYANRWWSYVQNLTRPGAGAGWVNAHFIDDGVPANTPSPGESTCGAAVPGGGGASTPQPGLNNSVFFSPTKSSDGLGEGRRVASLQLPEGDWLGGPCDSQRAIGWVRSLGDDVGTLSGWSLGRLGPLYALLSPSVRARVHRVVLFDPGNTANFKGSCEGRADFVNSLLAGWVKSNEANQLWILAGGVTEEREGGPQGRATFAGLWRYYLAGLWNQPFAARAHICDYPNLDHESVLRIFYWFVGTETDNGRCPRDRWTSDPVEWHP